MAYQRWYFKNINNTGRNRRKIWWDCSQREIFTKRTSNDPHRTTRGVIYIFWRGFSSTGRHIKRRDDKTVKRIRQFKTGTLIKKKILIWHFHFALTSLQEALDFFGRTYDNKVTWYYHKPDWEISQQPNKLGRP